MKHDGYRVRMKVLLWLCQSYSQDYSNIPDWMLSRIKSSVTVMAIRSVKLIQYPIVVLLPKNLLCPIQVKSCFDQLTGPPGGS